MFDISNLMPLIKGFLTAKKVKQFQESAVQQLTKMEQDNGGTLTGLLQLTEDKKDVCLRVYKDGDMSTPVKTHFLSQLNADTIKNLLKHV